jgi:hypothetical protein
MKREDNSQIDLSRTGYEGMNYRVLSNVITCLTALSITIKLVSSAKRIGND